MNEIKTLSYIWGGFGIFQVVVGLLFGVCFGLFGFVPLLSGDRDGAMVGGIFMTFAVVFTAMIVLFAIPNMIAAWGLSNNRRWAGILASILSVFMIFSFPIGTMIGGYTLYILYKPENQAALT